MITSLRAYSLPKLWRLISEMQSLAYYIQGSLRCHATHYCHGRGSSWRTAMRAEECVGNTQTATTQFPKPEWQRVGKGLVLAQGLFLSPQPVETKQTGSWTVGTCWSGYLCCCCLQTPTILQHRQPERSEIVSSFLGSSAARLVALCMWIQSMPGSESGCMWPSKWLSACLSNCHF